SKRNASRKARLRFLTAPRRTYDLGRSWTRTSTASSGNTRTSNTLPISASAYTTWPESRKAKSTCDRSGACCSVAFSFLGPESRHGSRVARCRNYACLGSAIDGAGVAESVRHLRRRGRSGGDEEAAHSLRSVPNE